MPSRTGTIVAVRNGRRVVRRVRNPSDNRGLTGVPRSADNASKYLRDCPSERSEYSKKGTSASSQPQARSPVSEIVAPSSGGLAPHGHVTSLVVAIARLRPDVRAGQGDHPIGGDGEAGRRVEPRRAGRDVDPGVHRDADRVAGIVDPGRDLIGEGRELLESRPDVELRGGAHHAASSPIALTTGVVAASPLAQ